LFLVDAPARRLRELDSFAAWTAALDEFYFLSVERSSALADRLRQFTW
jgi:hypothetical protein